MPNIPSLEQLERAVTIAAEIDRLQQELGQLLGGEQPAAGKESGAGQRRGERSSATTPAQPGGKVKRTRSPETRAKMVAAQRARWARVKGQSPESDSQKAEANPKSAKPKQNGRRTISPEARARIAEAARKRWADAKKAGKNSLS